MAEKKRQHYIPQFYMRNFANEKGTFMIYRLSEKDCIGPVPYSSQCYKDYYYGADGLWENRLGEMESNWGAVFKTILERKTLSDADIRLIKQFALYQRQRTFAESEYRKQERVELIAEYGKMLYAKKGWIFDQEAEKICEERARNETTPAENLEIAEKSTSLINDLSIVIIDYNTNTELISSDVPVIAINPFYPPSIGYACMGLIILFPITKHKLVVLYDSKMYTQYRDLLYAYNDDEDEVHNLNVLQLISAEKILFSYRGTEFSTFNEKEWEAREINRNGKVLSTLGPDGNKMLISSMRKTIYECELSFGQTSHRFKRIPFICREAVPRLWDSRWENKLTIKADVMTEILKVSPQLLDEYKITKKELRRGCQRMASAAKVYWTSNYSAN